MPPNWAHYCMVTTSGLTTHTHTHTTSISSVQSSRGIRKVGSNALYNTTDLHDFFNFSAADLLVTRGSNTTSLSNNSDLYCACYQENSVLSMTISSHHIPDSSSIGTITKFSLYRMSLNKRLPPPVTVGPPRLNPLLSDGGGGVRQVDFMILRHGGNGPGWKYDIRM